MPIYRGTTRVRPFQGDHAPANLYLGETKLDGWSPQTQSGEALEFENTYNDTMEVTLYGVSYANGTPSPIAPVPVYSVENTELYAHNLGGSLEQTVSLPTLRGIGSIKDSYSPVTGEYVRRIGFKTFNGTENWAVFNDSKFLLSGGLGGSVIPSSAGGLCTHLIVHDAAAASYITEGYIGWQAQGNLFVGAYSKFSGSLTDFKAWLAAQSAAGTPVTVYYVLAAPVTTYLDPVTISTYYPSTILEQDGVVPATINATAKVMEP